MELFENEQFVIEDILPFSGKEYNLNWRNQQIFYFSPQITFREVPDEISLTIPTICYEPCSKDCNSKYCWNDNWRGEKLKLTTKVLSEFIDQSQGISCVTIMTSLNFVALGELFQFVKEYYPHLKTALYIGVQWRKLLKYSDFTQFDFSKLDYLKVGRFRKKCGGLQCKTTNQKFYKIIHQNVGTIFEKNLFVCQNHLFLDGILAE